MAREVNLLGTVGGPKKRLEGNVATAADVTVEECPSEEEWDAEATICMEDDEVYFMEDLIDSGHLSTGDLSQE